MTLAGVSDQANAATDADPSSASAAPTTQTPIPTTQTPISTPGATPSAAPAARIPDSAAASQVGRSGVQVMVLLVLQPAVGR